MYDWRVKALMNWIKLHLNSDGKLEMEKLASAGHLDQYHYLGLQANDEVIRILGLSPGMHVLDVGCGIGGPARYMSWKSGAKFTGIDIQESLTSAGNLVSGLVGLEKDVHLICGDVCVAALDVKFDAFVSLLVILHIEDRTRLFSSLFDSLKPGGGFLIEDMMSLSPFGPEENDIAHNVIGTAKHLPNVSEYTQQLEAAGFVDIEFESLTPEWTRWCIDRSNQYTASKLDQITLHGEEIFAQRNHFYQQVKNLFESGKLGGVRITGRKPTLVETAIRNHRLRNRAQSDVNPVACILEKTVM